MSAAIVLLIFTILGDTWDTPVLRDIYFAKYDTTGLSTHLGGSAVQDSPAGAVIQGLASSSGLRDYYTFGMWGYCAGYNDGRDGHYCSNRTAAYRFNPIAAVQNDVPASQTIPVPSSVQDDLNILSILSLVSFAFFFVAIGLAFFALLFGIMGIGKRGFRFSEIVASGVSTLAFLFCAVASAIVTAMYVTVDNKFGQYYNDVGVSGGVGKAIALAWGATAALLLGGFTYCCSCCGGPGSGRPRKY